MDIIQHNFYIHLSSNQVKEHMILTFVLKKSFLDGAGRSQPPPPSRIWETIKIWADWMRNSGILGTVLIVWGIKKLGHIWSSPRPQVNRDRYAYVCMAALNICG